MGTFSRMALTATLALSALLSLIKTESVRAETKTVVKGSPAPQVERAPSSADRPAFFEPLHTSFDPEPNDPPVRTGGSGTR
jgi:hypothetical protein